MMMYSNIYSTIGLIIAIFFLSQWNISIQFCFKYPEVGIDIILLGIVAGLGQIAIYYLVANESALLCTIITTTRKLFTILLSVLWFNHALLVRQWVGIGLVFLRASTRQYCFIHICCRSLSWN